MYYECVKFICNWKAQDALSIQIISFEEVYYLAMVYIILKVNSQLRHPVQLVIFSKRPLLLKELFVIISTNIDCSECCKKRMVLKNLNITNFYDSLLFAMKIVSRCCFHLHPKSTALSWKCHFCATKMYDSSLIPYILEFYC